MIRLRRAIANDQLLLVLIALVIGMLGAFGVIAFRGLISLIQLLALGFDSAHVLDFARTLPWWRILLAPTLGGLMIGLFVRYAVPGRRPQGVPDVMEAAALRGGRLSLRTTIAGAVANAASIGVGGSVGREGAVIHLGATMASWLGQRLRLPPAMIRTALGCGVASAVAASFNAPIAGVFFALEVVIGNYAISTFAPLVVASVIGTVISRLYYGDFPSFILPQYQIVSPWEYFAFALLGLVCAAVSLSFMTSAQVVEQVVERFGIPRWLRPTCGGLLLGLIALVFPHVLGVGYDSIDQALFGTIPLWLMIALVVAKTAATSICIGTGFGGGDFSASLFLGAMTGGAFGLFAAQAFPDLASSHGAYSLVGMGAVAGPVLGAPITTILIIFEMTGDYAMTLAVMIAVVVSSLIVNETFGRSMYMMKLEHRGINLKGGREVSIFSSIPVADLMRRAYASVRPEAPMSAVIEALRTAPYGLAFVVDEEGRLSGQISVADLAPMADSVIPGGVPVIAADIANPRPVVLEAGDDPRRAIRLMEARMGSHLPVVRDKASMRMVGVVDVHELVLAYHKALLEARAEERGEGQKRRYVPRRHAPKAPPAAAPAAAEAESKPKIPRPKTA
ncbi:MAG: chloride channel protein [Alphaproteobacteria bacterium]